ncbi:uncharacterized protein LOC143868723 [Tasmannia lanceolata]|uniref:uncharacterized protein LOC143868723 n=1 Tax=Tasmannia lanceolata TaxID=3420 RepID=UPI0040634BA3
MESLQVTKKDKVIFCTKANHEVPSKYELPAPLASEEKRGVLLPNGELNWTCPCLGGLPYGPCGFEFREFFGCIHKAQESEDPDKSRTQECFPKFAAMKECFSHFPKLYPPDEDGPETDLGDQFPKPSGDQTATDGKAE